MCKTPDLNEVSKVISMLYDGKSPGTDGLQPEVKREGRLVEVLYTIMRCLGKLGSPFPSSWKDIQLATIFKKVDRWDCGNHYRLSLFSIQEKA